MNSGTRWMLTALVFALVATLPVLWAQEVEKPAEPADPAEPAAPVESGETDEFAEADAAVRLAAEDGPGGHDENHGDQADHSRHWISLRNRNAAMRARASGPRGIRAGLEPPPGFEPGAC